MVLKWKLNEERDKALKEESIAAPFPEDIMKKSFEDIIKDKPSKHVTKKERWCNFNNAETSRPNKYSEKITQEGYYILIYNFLSNSKLQAFTTDDLIKKLGAENLTEGTLQRRVLALMVCSGLVRKHIIEYENKQGKKKLKYVFSWVGPNLANKCLKFRNNKCSFDWENEGRESKYF